MKDLARGIGGGSSLLRLPTAQTDFDADPIRIGIVILNEDMGVESELNRLVLDAVAVHLARTTSYVGLDPCEAIGAIEKSASTILPGTKLSAMAYACSSGSFALDHQLLRRALASGRKDTPAITVRDAVIEALANLRIRKICLLTPYDLSTTTLVVEHLESANVRILRAGFLALDANDQLATLKSDRLLECAVSIDAPDADGMLILCNALQTSEVVPKIEMIIGKPVIASTQALLWHCLRLNGFSRFSQAKGLLFASM